MKLESPRMKNDSTLWIFRKHFVHWRSGMKKLTLAQVLSTGTGACCLWILRAVNAWRKVKAVGKCWKRRAASIGRSLPLERCTHLCVVLLPRVSGASCLNVSVKMFLCCTAVKCPSKQQPHCCDAISCFCDTKRGHRKPGISDHVLVISVWNQLATYLLIVHITLLTCSPNKAPALAKESEHGEAHEH